MSLCRCGTVLFVDGYTGANGESLPMSAKSLNSFLTIEGRSSVRAIAWRTRLLLIGFFRLTRRQISRCVAPRVEKICTFELLNTARPVANCTWLHRSIWPPSRPAIIAASSA